MIIFLLICDLAPEHTVTHVFDFGAVISVLLKSEFLVIGIELTIDILTCGISYCGKYYPTLKYKFEIFERDRPDPASAWKI